MKNKLVPAFSTVALILAVSGNPALPDAVSNDFNPIFQVPSADEKASEEDKGKEHKEQPLTDMDEIITVLNMAPKYTF